MADLRIVDAPEIPTENITGQEKLPTGGSGNYSITLDSVADYTKTKKDLADNATVDTEVNGVRQELNAHIEDSTNPHQVTKDQIGLGNVDNTADLDKPVSNSTQSAIISAIAPKADKTYVDNTLSNLSTEANKFYPTLAEANADIANITVDQPVTIGEVINGGLWYKETEDATSLIKSPFDPLQQSKEFTILELAKYLKSISTRSGWSLPFIDSIDQILGGFDANGKFNAEGIEVVTVLKDALSRLSSLEGVIVSTSNPSRTGVIFSIQDNEDQLLIHLTTDMQLYVAGMPVGVNQSIIDDIDDLKNDVSVINDNLNSLNTFVALGDSLTEGAGSSGGNTYPYYASQALGRSVSNQGIGGQDALRISARLNGASLLATFADNTIPADTTAKAVTLNIPLLTTPATTAARTRKCWIAGIHGTLAKDTSNNYTFARDVAGSVVNVAPNSHVFIDTIDLQNRIALIWMGTNNSFATESDRQAVVDNIDLVIKSLKPINKRYLVLSPWKPASNIKGSDTHNQMLEMHKLLATKYKERFVNVWWDLVCSYDSNEPQDVMDFGNMVIPLSLRASPSDFTHLNSNGYQIIGSQSIPNKINQLGW